MTIRLYTDHELAELRSMPKRAVNPGAQWLVKPKERPVHRQRTLEARSQPDGPHFFSIYLRQNLKDLNDFSCGLAYLAPGSRPLTLARYNGPSHRHGDINYSTHIHRASHQAIAAGRRPESEAEETDRYTTLEGALACMIDDFNLSGINAQRDAPRLIP